MHIKNSLNKNQKDLSLYECWRRTPQNLQHNPQTPGVQQPQQNLHLMPRFSLMLYGICVTDRRHEQCVRLQHHHHSVHSCYIRTLCGETHPASGESARCVRPHSFSQLGSPSRSPLMSPPAQQVGTQHSLAPPLPAPVGEVRTFTTGDTFLDVDEILVDDK